MDIYTHNILHNVSYVSGLQHYFDWSLAIFGQGEQNFCFSNEGLAEAVQPG
jgi:hypothetical protein